MNSAMSTALSGLMANRQRLYTSASNVANWQSRGRVPATPPSQPVSGGNGGPRVYQAVQVTQSAAAGGGVQTQQQPVLPAYQLQYEPEASYANTQGYVAAPTVDLAQEAVNQMEARQAFKANIATIKTADEMEKSLLDVIA